MQSVCSVRIQVRDTNSSAHTITKSADNEGGEEELIYRRIFTKWIKSYISYIWDPAEQT